VNRQYGALSGIAVVLIALNHAIHFGLQLAPADGAWRFVLTSVQALGVFAVPAFLFVSGAFLSYTAREMSFTFVQRSLDRILWPYVIWSLIFYVLLTVTGVERHSIAGHIKNLLVGYPYHFIPLLVFWYVGAPLVAKIGRRHAVALLAAVALAQYFLIVLRYPGAILARGTLPEWLGALAPPVLFTTLADWALYFPLGLVLGMHDAQIRSRLSSLRWMLVGATVLLFVLSALHGFRLVSAPWARLVVPLPLMFLLPLIDRKSIPLTQGLEMLGRRSYGIYLMHFVVVNIIVILASRAGDALAGWTVVVALALFVAALAFPVSAMGWIAKTESTRKAYRYLFGAVPPSAEVSRRLRPESRRTQSAANVGTSA
jgi:fucose 4-O-acetylase-like acetyltransferase